jgi:hypothetical protein
MNIKIVLIAILVTIVTRGLKFNFSGGFQGSVEGLTKTLAKNMNYISTSPQGIAVSAYREDTDAGEITAKIIVNSAAQFFGEDSNISENFEENGSKISLFVNDSLDKYNERLKTINIAQKLELSDFEIFMKFSDLDRSFISAFVKMNSD